MFAKEFAYKSEWKSSSTLQEKLAILKSRVCSIQKISSSLTSTLIFYLLLG